MSKVTFLLELSGLQAARIDDDGAFIRPPTAEEIVVAIAEDIEARVNHSGTWPKVKIRIARIP